jgi:hypothetical protein
MRIATRAIVLGIAVGLTSTLGLGSTVSATSTRVTREDAEAVYQTVGGAAQAIRLHASVNAGGAPVQWPQTAMNPLNPNRTFCVLDWHTIMLAAIDGGNRSTYSNQEAKALLAAVTISFTLDGAPVATGTTAIKRHLNPDLFGWDFAWFRNFGTVVPPGTPSVGTHDLVAIIQDPVFGTEVINYRLEVDAAGTGSCL